MKLEKRLLAAAKGISLWWGIYLILGCCARLCGANGT